MGMTWWLKVRRGDSIECGQYDYSLMNRFAEELDEIAARSAVGPLSGFQDLTDIGREMADLGDELDDAEEEPTDVDDDIEPAIGDYAWFEAGDGLKTVESVLQVVRDEPGAFRFEGDSTRAHWRERLIEELEDCRSVLAGAASSGLSFHLTLVS